MSDENSDMQKSSRSESQVLMAHGFSVLGKWTKSSLGAPSAHRRETPGEPGRHHGKIARELGVVAILRAPLIELRHRLRQREAGLPLAGRILPGTQQALIQLTHVLQQEALGFRPLAGHPDDRGAVL